MWPWSLGSWVFLQLGSGVLKVTTNSYFTFHDLWIMIWISVYKVYIKNKLKSSMTLNWCNSFPPCQVSWMQNFQNCCQSVRFSLVDLFFLATRNAGGGGAIWGGTAGISTGGFRAFAEEECWGHEIGDCSLPETGPDDKPSYFYCSCFFRKLRIKSSHFLYTTGIHHTYPCSEDSFQSLCLCISLSAPCTILACLAPLL